MLKVLYQVNDILGSRARRQAYGVFALVLVMGLVEAAGVASIMPFVAVLSNPSVVETNRYLAMLHAYLGFESVDAFLLFLGAATFVLLMSSILIRAVTLWAQTRFVQFQIHEVGSRLLRHYLAQPYQWFLNRSTSEFGANVLWEVGTVLHGVVSQLMLLLTNAFVAVLLFGVLIVADPFLALLVTAVLGGAYVLVYLLVSTFLRRIGEQRVFANRGRFKAMQEAFGGIKDVKTNGLEPEFLHRFMGPSWRMARLSIIGTLIRELPSFVMQAVVFGGMLLVLIYLIWAHGTFQEALPYIALYALAGYRLMPTLQGIYKTLAELRFSIPALNALQKDVSTLNSDLALPSVSSHRERRLEEPLGIRSHLELRAVELQYEGAAKPALSDVSLRIEANTTVGLVGSTGSGKTTLVDVVLGLLQVTRGQLLVDGREITADCLRAWQRTVGYVPQTIFLADDTVAANIAFGVPPDAIDHAAVERAARAASLHDFVSRQLPLGYATEIGERGVRLSGGQRQRIGIARALYHDPSLLIFDEATSALDNLTEKAVMDAVMKLGGEKTIILVAHRLSTVRHCDRIVLLEEGRLLATGTYQELLEKSDTFRQMAAAATG